VRSGFVSDTALRPFNRAPELRNLECDLVGELVIARDVAVAEAKPLEPVEQTLQFGHGKCVGVVRHEFGTLAPRSGVTALVRRRTADR
jgi:hypothetical protein